MNKVGIIYKDKSGIKWVNDSIKDRQGLGKSRPLWSIMAPVRETVPGYNSLDASAPVTISLSMDSPEKGE